MNFLKYLCVACIAGVLLNSCSKEYSMEHMKGTTGNWQFSNVNSGFSGYLDGIYRTAGDGTHRLSITGKTYDGSHLFAINLYGDSFAPGTYSSSSAQCSFSYSIPGKTIYEASQLTGEFIVILKSIDSINISGTFSGTAIDSAHNVVQISNGKFLTQ